MKKDHILLLLLVTIGVLFLLVIVGFTRWTDVRGTFFTNISSLHTTTGIIASSSVYYEDSTRGGAYYYDIVYEFTVNGDMYSSDQVTFGPTSFSARSDALQYIAQYPVGAKVKVYYDPSDPAFSVLEPEVNSYSDFLILISCLSFFPLVAIFVIRLNTKQIRRHIKRRTPSRNEVARLLLCCPTQRALDWRVRAAFSGIFLDSSQFR